MQCLFRFLDFYSSLIGIVAPAREGVNQFMQKLE